MLFKPDFRAILQPWKLKKALLRDASFVILKVTKKGSILLKSRDHQKAHLGPLPNVHVSCRMRAFGKILPIILAFGKISLKCCRMHVLGKKIRENCTD